MSKERLLNAWLCEIDLQGTSSFNVPHEIGTGSSDENQPQ